jgi:hypothetical protein
MKTPCLAMLLGAKYTVWNGELSTGPVMLAQKPKSRPDATDSDRSHQLNEYGYVTQKPIIETLLFACRNIFKTIPMQLRSE